MNPASRGTLSNAALKGGAAAHSRAPSGAPPTLPPTRPPSALAMKDSPNSEEGRISTILLALVIDKNDGSSSELKTNSLTCTSDSSPARAVLESIAAISKTIAAATSNDSAPSTRRDLTLSNVDECRTGTDCPFITALSEKERAPTTSSGPTPSASLLEASAEPLPTPSNDPTPIPEEDRRADKVPHSPTDSTSSRTSDYF